VRRRRSRMGVSVVVRRSGGTGVIAPGRQALSRRLRCEASAFQPYMEESMLPTRVLLFSRPGCHLCDDARAVVEQVCAELGVGWRGRSIAGDPELERLYAEQIPVTFVDDRQHDFWRVDPVRLRRALTS